jgi:hypothetical protein
MVMILHNVGSPYPRGVGGTKQRRACTSPLEKCARVHTFAYCSSSAKFVMSKSLAYLVCCREHVAKLSSLFSRSTPAPGSELMALRVYRHFFRRVGLSVLAEKSVAAGQLIDR